MVARHHADSRWSTPLMLPRIAVTSVAGEIDGSGEETWRSSCTSPVRPARSMVTILSCGTGYRRRLAFSRDSGPRRITTSGLVSRIAGCQGGSADNLAGQLEIGLRRDDGTDDGCEHPRHSGK